MLDVLPQENPQLPLLDTVEDDILTPLVNRSRRNNNFGLRRKVGRQEDQVWSHYMKQVDNLMKRKVSLDHSYLTELQNQMLNSQNRKDAFQNFGNANQHILPANYELIIENLQNPVVDNGRKIPKRKNNCLDPNGKYKIVCCIMHISMQFVFLSA